MFVFTNRNTDFFFLGHCEAGILSLLTGGHSSRLEIFGIFPKDPQFKGVIKKSLLIGPFYIILWLHMCPGYQNLP